MVARAPVRPDDGGRLSHLLQHELSDSVEEFRIIRVRRVIGEIALPRDQVHVDIWRFGLSRQGVCLGKER